MRRHNHREQSGLCLRKKKGGPPADVFSQRAALDRFTDVWVAHGQDAIPEIWDFAVTFGLRPASTHRTNLRFEGLRVLQALIPRHGTSLHPDRPPRHASCCASIRSRGTSGSWTGTNSKLQCVLLPTWMKTRWMSFPRSKRSKECVANWTSCTAFLWTRQCATDANELEWCDLVSWCGSSQRRGTALCAVQHLGWRSRGRCWSRLSNETWKWGSATSASQS